MKQITIIGSGYVGTTLAAMLSNSGYQTYLLDIDQTKIDIIKTGKSHFFEAGLDSFITGGIDSGNLFPTVSYEEAIPGSDIIFSCVGTPDNRDGSSNLSFIKKATESTAVHVFKDIIFVQRSTVPVGTGRELIQIFENNTNKKVTYVSNPEFLAEGRAVLDSLNPSRIVLGSDDQKKLEDVQQLFNAIYNFAKDIDVKEFSDFASTYSNFKTKINEPNYIFTSLESAELIKVTANAFLATKISFTNATAKLADASGADITEVMNGVGADPRIGRSFLYAGLGFGGGCFPKDVSGLISNFKDNNVANPILDGVVEVNKSMPEYLLRKLQSLGSEIRDKKVAILGLSFKPGTSDARKSQSVILANLLVDRVDKVKAFDPIAMEEAKHDLSKGVELTSSIEEAVKSVDIVIIATEWPIFKELDWVLAKELMNGNIIVDGRNCLNKEEIINLGFEYVGVGR